MKVKEFVEQLKRFDPELDILCCTEDEGLLAPDHLFRLLEITSVGIVDGEKTRGEDGVPSLKIGKTANSQKHVVIDVTTDF